MSKRPTDPIVEIEAYLFGSHLGERISDALATQDLDLVLKTIDECAREILNVLGERPRYTFDEVRDLILARINEAMEA